MSKKRVWRNAWAKLSFFSSSQTWPNGQNLFTHFLSNFNDFLMMGILQLVIVNIGKQGAQNAFSIAVNFWPKKN